MARSEIAERRALARSTGDPDYERRRSELLKAAAKIFKEQGYRAANVQDIAREVGIDRATFYYYAASKEDLLHERIHQLIVDNVRMVEDIRDSAETPPHKLSKLIVGLMVSFERHYPYPYVYIQEDMTRITQDQSGWAREMGRLAKRFDEAVIAILQSGLADGSFRLTGGDARLAAYSIIGMCNWSHRWFRPRHRQSAEAVGNAFAEIVLPGIDASGAEPTEQISKPR